MKVTFLPLTVDAARRLGARPLLDQAVRTDRAAAECWTALLAGCGTAARRDLGPQLRRLSEATSMQVGSRWWFAEGAGHRRRVAGAQENLEEAIAEGDGQEFALAFVGYDHAMASAVVCANSAHPSARKVGEHRA
ncbi:hypothetical protein AMES_7936 [Amycolatopsis mediterranei S699]|uniref:Uncharacterized protein n=2 Tax=Amycolatopsis mediterranei TaxID=33910 RepID=A0A0H3DFX9_AMYMU|nr:hypothetical protein [Amycolatopsis mediterranei]ADJ49760.1 conserved hypothetical protein [Amycolatopsis mediterranei U32]AEK46747.1 hypothetical protein RAM_41400 [Amycolatopsis mediterranei S699]AFO81469.1 hypothetical protein AMES_7936 [Amycolatopsis mediterranei S699]AGT88598.1 hypothetical protein B737_7937 [Amycolatopsis mediterranei RB]KDO07991.1 hypothetical protein DV26_27275 [Amycolatopsis mediterranei]